jgi:ATP-dependent DNA ligase
MENAIFCIIFVCNCDLKGIFSKQVNKPWKKGGKMKNWKKNKKNILHSTFYLRKPVKKGGK